MTLAGFKTQAVNGIRLGAAQDVRRRFSLEVGAMEESVTVSGSAPLVNVASPEQRINLDPQEVTTLPSANRNLTNLLNLVPGLTRQEGAVEGGGAGSGGGGGIRLRLNGLGGAAMSITANGTDASANAGARQISQYNGISKIDIVSIESVGEVNIVKGHLTGRVRPGARRQHEHRDQGRHQRLARQPVLPLRGHRTWSPNPSFCERSPSPSGPRAAARSAGR